MADIEIQVPVRLKASILETEDYLGSFRAEWSIIIPTSTGQITYDGADIWIRYSDWDAFIAGIHEIREGKAGPALLQSIDEKLRITFQQGPVPHFVLNIQSRPAGNQSCSIDFECASSMDELAHWETKPSTSTRTSRCCACPSTN
jgi:hypothetical protein